MLRPSILLILLAFQAAAAIFPLKDLRPGMKGVGRTVFQGDKVEEFQVEILGILENAGPKQNVILARLSGGPLERTGVMQGMSGSPVYIDGRLAGAVALAFQFSKEPIAGIRPIEEMLSGAAEPPRPSATVRAALTDKSLTERLPRPEQPAGRLQQIATPLSFTGFPASTVERFAPELRALGFEPMQALSGGGRQDVPPPAKPLEPGSMISVQLMSGDMSVGADGTVTHIDGNKVYAFGHRFLSVGSTELPFARSSVLTLLPSLNTSFKISSSGAWAGSILQDNSVGVTGELGRRTALVPLDISVNGRARYRMQMVNDPLLSPLLLQMAIYGTLDATERTLGVSTITVRGAVEFANQAVPSFRWENLYAGDYNVPLTTSLAATIPIAWALQNNTDALKLRSVKLDLETHAEKRQMLIEEVWTSRRRVRPGETLEIYALLAGNSGQEETRRLTWQVPVGAQTGTLNITVADGPTANAVDYLHLNLTEPRPATQLVSLLNELRGNTKAYVRLWRADPAYTVQGKDLPDPPPSMALIIGRSQGSLAPIPRTSTVAELSLDAGGLAVSGSRTAQVEIID